MGKTFGRKKDSLADCLIIYENGTTFEVISCTNRIVVSVGIEKIFCHPMPIHCWKERPSAERHLHFSKEISVENADSGSERSI